MTTPKDLAAQLSVPVERTDMNTILSDDERPKLPEMSYLGDDASWGYDASDMEAYADAREAAVLAKMREQEPVAWMVKDEDARTFIFRSIKPTVHKGETLTPLYATPQPAVAQVPDGWKLVPVEPTEEMIQAANDGDDAYTLRNFGPGVQRVMQGPHDHYVAMLAAAPEAPAQAAQSAGEVERGDVVAFEFYNRATGHAIVDYSVNTHVGKLSADKGYEARPLVYADKREEVTDGSKPIPLWQAREALDELETAARGDAPFNHQAAAVVRAALSHKEPQR